MKHIKADVVIIGAGIVGCALAWELAQYKLTTVVLEREADVGWGASKANSGIIHAALHAKPGTMKAKLCREGNKLYQKLAKEVGVPLRHTGMLMVARDHGQLAQLEEIRKQGLTNGEVGLRILSRQQVLTLEPELAPDIVAGLLAPSACTIAPYQMVIALYEAAQANGVNFYFEEPVQGIGLKNGCLAFVSTPSLQIHTSWAIDAAGLAAGEVAALAGCGFRLHPRAGEEYLLDKQWGDLVRHLIFPLPTANSKGILAIPTADGNLMVGPNAKDGITSLSTTNQGREEVFRLIGQLLPKVRGKTPIASFAGVRPAALEGDFLIGPTDVTGFYLAAGMESPGLTAAPAVAKSLVAMLAEDGLPLVRKERLQKRKKPLLFRELSSQQRARLIKKDPRWGRIICRCEEVTEAEVVEAIRRGARTVDGVKFRTRLGMGRCQGGFCGPRVLSLLARELGISPSQVTKKGAGSELAPYTSKQLLLAEDEEM